MPKTFHKVAEVTLAWQRRGNLSDNDRSFARQVSELAFAEAR